MVAMADARDVDAAVAAAVEAFPSWSVTDPPERIALIERMRDDLRAAERGDGSGDLDGDGRADRSRADPAGCRRRFAT